MSGLETLWNLSNSHHTRDAKPCTGQLGIDWHKRTQLLNQRVEAEHPHSVAFALAPHCSHSEATEAWPHGVSLICMLGVKAPSSVMALISNFTDYVAATFRKNNLEQTIN
jgi:hypothetical protein